MSDMREKYESLALNDLKEIAKVRGIRISGLKKAELIEAMLKEDKKDEEKGKVVEAKSIIPRGRKRNFPQSWTAASRRTVFWK